MEISFWKQQVAKIQIYCYLLEQSRVAFHSFQERNFHIFYQLCQGLSKTMKTKLIVLPPSEFYYLSQGQQKIIAGVDDSVDFGKTNSNLQAIGLTEQHIQDIYRLLVGILYIGNIEFDPTVLFLFSLCILRFVVCYIFFCL